MRQLYASTRADEMALTGWTAEQQDAFLQMQFNAQRQYYREQFPTAEYCVIQHAGVDIGRLIIHRADGELLLMDIALLPEYRSSGIGTALIRDLMAEAAQTGKAMRLHVEFFNRALRLYERLGFSKIGDTGIYFEMEWRANAQ
jgi:ribosomal protein S18 acetylase RimI-like enzyme